MGSCASGTTPRESCSSTSSALPLFGPRYLVAPVLELGARERTVYLPAGTWRDLRDGSVTEGPAEVVAAAPLESIPVYERM